ncbi:MAG TPA: glucose-6-phosphate isomerase, partial [Candidatus Sumerlaeota bacterium]|nr:glucose-6-phosphate isomerase [Candidatus Sumerlaeota bacterium]
MADNKLISYDYGSAMAAMVGEEHGVTEQEIKALQARTSAIHDDLAQKRKDGELGFFDLPYDNLLVQAITAISSDIRRNFENFVVVGIGGSCLGPMCLHHALNHSCHNDLPVAKRRNRPRLYFLDNPDPDMVKDLLDTLDLRTTAFNIISKSGSTPETMAIFMHIYNVVQRRFSKTALSKHFIVTTDPDKGMLRDVAIQDKMKTLPIPSNVGGRFSVFSPVGLLPAAVSGINIKGLLEGAAAMDKSCFRPDLSKSMAYLNAAIHYIADQKKKKPMSVMMPYSSALRTVSDWYTQLWAESLGKRFDLNGREVFVGQTPIKALGAVDQHSQIQLYTEGPNDKITTFVHVRKFAQECKAVKVFHTLEDLL